MLLVLCILSWIYTGLGLITSLMGLLRGPLSAEKMKEVKVNLLGLLKETEALESDVVTDMVAKSIRITEVQNQHHYAVYSLTLLVILIGIYGVYNMFQGKKIGFHLYIIYSLLSVTQIYFFMKVSEVSTVSAIFGFVLSGLFIFLYSRNLKWMK